jgi:hypothetical protein
MYFELHTLQRLLSRQVSTTAAYGPRKSVVKLNAKHRKRVHEERERFLARLKTKITQPNLPVEAKVDYIKGLYYKLEKIVKHNQKKGIAREVNMMQETFQQIKERLREDYHKLLAQHPGERSSLFLLLRNRSCNCIKN